MDGRRSVRKHLEQYESIIRPPEALSAFNSEYRYQPTTKMFGRNKRETMYTLVPVQTSIWIYSNQCCLYPQAFAFRKSFNLGAHLIYWFCCLRQLPL